MRRVDFWRLRGQLITQLAKRPGYFTLGRGLAPPANGIPQARREAPRLTSTPLVGSVESPDLVEIGGREAPPLLASEDRPAQPRWWQLALS